jgi:hypothetical protein
MSAYDPGKRTVAALAIACALLVAGNGAAQETEPTDEPPAELDVKVSSKSGELLRGVTVYVNIEAANHQRSTDAAGLARFTELPSGDATVQATMNGWKPAGKKVALTAGKRLELRLTLERSAAPKKPAPSAPRPTGPLRSP